MRVTTGKKEIEYKFLLPGSGTSAAILEQIGSKGYRIQRLRTIHQEDLYFDTFEWRLFRRGLSLRMRRVTGKIFYSLKSIGNFEEGRTEQQDIEVESHLTDTTMAHIKEIQTKIADIIYPRQLIGQLTVRTERQPYMVTTTTNAKIKLVFDTTGFMARGFNSPRRSRRLFEIGAELIKGSPTELNAFKQRLTDAISLTPSSQSKLETAIERLSITFPTKNPPPDFQVHREDRLDQAVKKIIAFQLKRIDENIPGVFSDIDTEFVHQGRVAIRKIRSLIRLFSGAITEKTGSRFAEELFWLGSLFGEVRDLDVFLLSLPRLKENIEIVPRRGMDILLKQITKERSTHLAKLKAGLSSSRWNQLHSGLVAFSVRPLAKNPSAPLATVPLDAAVPPIITARYESVIAQGNRVFLEPDLAGFHKLRIRFKKLRYALEFVSPAYGRSLDPLINETVKIQDCLGDLQDTVFTRTLIDRLLKRWKGNVLDPRMLFMLGELYALQGEIARAKQTEFNRIWKRFDQDSQRMDMVSAFSKN